MSYPRARGMGKISPNVPAMRLRSTPMPRAIPYATRQEIVRRHLDGQTLLQIAAELRLPLAAVRDLWRAFRDRGDDGLAIRYHAPDRPGRRSHRAVLRRACQLK